MNTPAFAMAALAVVSLVSTSSTQAAVSVPTLLTRFNVIAGDYTAGNETEGSAFVMGQYYPQDSRSRFGFNSGQVANDSINTLWLNNGLGNASGNVTLMTGSVVSRVAVDHSRFTMNGNAPGTPSFNEGTTAWNNALSTLGVNDVAEVNSALLAASDQWKGLAANSTGNLPGNGSYTFNATPTMIGGHSVAVFSVGAGTLFAQNSTFDRLEANFNGAETILINVSGTGSFTVNKNFTNGFTNNESKILFNFYEATNVTLGTNFRGAVYAPRAKVTQAGSNVDGTVVAANFIQTAEVHNVYFNSYLPYTTIPEPGAAALGLVGMVMLLRRKR
ncbi:MAG: choice-of-anchor A family protein [Verrucomicrobiaceae bacterium]|nr:MAG: choice-of-anchor A family protein [Verrucomicrobiaceae bacterium]